MIDRMTDRQTDTDHYVLLGMIDRMTDRQTDTDHYVLLALVDVMIDRTTNSCSSLYFLSRRIDRHQRYADIRHILRIWNGYLF